VASVCVDPTYFTVTDSGQLSLVPGVEGLRAVVYFKDPGTHQFVKADYPWLARLRIRVQAGGGGAAGASAGKSQVSAQPGGAGGGYAEVHHGVSILGAVETVVVGAGGTAGSATADGGTGGNSSFGGLATANGGAGGTSVMSGGTDPVSFSGIPGPLAGIGNLVIGGGAGGGALRLNGSDALSGAGGDSVLGHGGAQRSSTGGGGAPRGYGGGAAGALAKDGISVNGTPGGDGIVIVELYG
jgi:hypothetical protein